MVRECYICDKTSDQVRIIDHHVSYDPEQTIPVCDKCHSAIHNKQKYRGLRPSKEEINEYYGSFEDIDKSKIPDKPGWTKVIKSVTCGRDNCNRCPHGRYYYYAKHTADGYEWDYGGKIVDSMLVEQTTMETFVDGS